MTDEEQAAKKAQRRARIQRDAEEHMARFEKLSPEEKKQAKNDGDLEHYTHEAQVRPREGGGSGHGRGVVGYPAAPLA